jgi:hypothetical protein
VLPALTFDGHAESLTPATKKKRETHKTKKTQAKKKPTRSVEENVVEKHKSRAPKVVRSQDSRDKYLAGTISAGKENRRISLPGCAAVGDFGNFDTCLWNK